MCELTLQMILLCNCSLSLNVCDIDLQCNLRFLSTTVLQGSVATRVNGGRIFNYFFIANLLLSVMVKNFEDRLGCGKVMAKNKVALFSRTRCSAIHQLAGWQHVWYFSTRPCPPQILLRRWIRSPVQSLVLSLQHLLGRPLPLIPGTQPRVMSFSK